MAKKMYPGGVYLKKDKTSFIQKVNIDEIVFRNNGETITLKKGDFIEYLSKDQKLASLEDGLKEGRLSEEDYEKYAEYAQSMPDFIICDMIISPKR